MTTTFTPESANLDPRTLDHAAVPQGGRRRQIVVDARYQTRAGLLVGSIAIVLLALLNASLLNQARGGAGAVRTGATWARSHGSGDAVSWTILLLGSAVFLGGVVLIGVLESHRTAGAAYAIRRSLDAIRDGRSGERIRLRKNDNLKDLAEAVNRLAESIDAERARRS